MGLSLLNGCTGLTVGSLILKTVIRSKNSTAKTLVIMQIFSAFATLFTGVYDLVMFLGGADPNNALTYIETI